MFSRVGGHAPILKARFLLVAFKSAGDGFRREAPPFGNPLYIMENRSGSEFTRRGLGVQSVRSALDFLWGETWDEIESGLGRVHASRPSSPEQSGLTCFAPTLRALEPRLPVMRLSVPEER